MPFVRRYNLSNILKTERKRSKKEEKNNGILVAVLYSSPFHSFIFVRCISKHSLLMLFVCALSHFIYLCTFFIFCSIFRTSSDSTDVLCSDASPYMRLFRLKVLDIMSTIRYESILAKQYCNNKIIIIIESIFVVSQLGSIQSKVGETFQV